MINVCPFLPSSIHDILNQFLSSPQQILRNFFEIVACDLNSVLLSPNRENDIGLGDSAKTLFSELRFLSDFSNKGVIQRKIASCTLVLQLLHNIVGNSVIEIKAAQVSISVCCEDIKATILDFHDGNVKSSTTQIVDKNSAVAFIVQAVRNRCGSRLI